MIMIKICLELLLLITMFFNKSQNQVSDWQINVPAKEHISSYQIICKNGRIHYSVNGVEYQYYLELEQQAEKDEKTKFVVLSNDRDLMYQTVYDSLISSQQKNYEKDFYYLGYEVTTGTGSAAF